MLTDDSTVFHRGILKSLPAIPVRRNVIELRQLHGIAMVR